ncbi:MAG: phosphoribosylformylglycinamidine synthase subunit PurQ [Patescibacteria group bacterium]|nr:phosphoribosylformylglycinamidine synthase subunit PurQ [Patescibacteria group bacterium]MDE1965788.1 phosphoribosylformylglycinamidine synthase subunit PurQ [Patescibacteria group bacterium]
MKPRTLIFSGYGLNSEDETKVAFTLAGGEADIVHVNDLLESPKLLDRYQIIVFPGGFSYGDDTGSGKAYGRKVHHHLASALDRFLDRDTLMAGICNGFQILTNTGILPGALIANTSGRFTCRYVDLDVRGTSPWLAGLSRLSFVVSHGEGRYFDTEKNLDKLEAAGAVALTYAKGETASYSGLPANPNGSLRAIAGITGFDGRVIGLMPHPERALFFASRPDASALREALIRAGKSVPKFADGLAFFKNAVRYFA